MELDKYQVRAIYNALAFLGYISIIILLATFIGVIKNG